MTIRLTPVKYITVGFKPWIGQTLSLSTYFVPRAYKVVWYVKRPPTERQPHNLGLYRATVTPIYSTEEAVKSLLEDQ